MIGRRCGNQRGTAIIEFAVVLPLLLTLIFTTIDFGIFFFVQHTVQFATREGVRLALVGRTVTDGAGNALDREASIVKTIRDAAAIAVNPDKLEISIYPVDAGFSDPADWRATKDAGSGGSFMRVRTIYSYRFLTPVLGALVAGGHIDVRAEATYRNEWF